jgi:hypothetical protein
MEFDEKSNSECELDDSFELTIQAHNREEIPGGCADIWDGLQNADEPIFRFSS